MPRKPAILPPDLLALPAKPVAPPPPPPAPEPPSLLPEYQPRTATEKWRVELFGALAQEFQFPAGSDWQKLMASFHEVAQSNTRGWIFVREVFGIAPLIIPHDAPPDAFALRSRTEAAELAGISPAQLQAEFDGLRAVWLSFAERLLRPLEPAPTLLTGPDGQGEFKDDEEEVLKRWGFDPKMFRVRIYDETVTDESNPTKMVARGDEKNRAERSWFVQRCRDWDSMFKEPRARTFLRSALLDELYLMRIQDEMSSMTPGMDRFDGLDKQKNRIEERYNKAIEKLESMFPDSNIAGRVNYRQVVSALIKAHQDFGTNGNTKLRDALFSGPEIEVLMRQSIQNPVAQYRITLSLLATEAMHGLFDPEFRSKLEKRPRLLKKIEMAAKAAIETARQFSGEELVDLMDGVEPGTGSQFPEVLTYED